MKFVRCHLRLQRPVEEQASSALPRPRAAARYVIDGQSWAGFDATALPLAMPVTLRPRALARMEKMMEETQEVLTPVGVDDGEESPVDRETHTPRRRAECLAYLRGQCRWRAPDTYLCHDELCELWYTPSGGIWLIGRRALTLRLFRLPPPSIPVT